MRCSTTELHRRDGCEGFLQVLNAHGGRVCQEKDGFVLDRSGRGSSIAARAICAFSNRTFSIIMGKQHNKEIKRRRRKALTKRRKEAVRVAKANPAAAKSAAVARREAAPKKKSAPRKAAPAKKAEPVAAAEE